MSCMVKNPKATMATTVPQEIYDLIEKQLLPHETKSKYLAEAIRREILRRGV
jgi:hypothetical protein